MNIVQIALFKLAKTGIISETELKVLNALHKKEQNFLELSQNTNTELMELKEILSEYSKKKLVNEFNGKYSIDSLVVAEKLIEKTEKIKQFA